MPGDYTPLPGRSVSALGSARLYRGPDHLLHVANSGYSEAYRRFYFRDIQAILIQQTALGRTFNFLFGALLGLYLLVFGLIYSSGTENPALALAWGLGLGVLFAAPLVVNVLRGPTCLCLVQTAVQTERLRAVTRWWAANKLLGQITPLIRQAQGQSPPQAGETRLGAGFDAGVETTAPAQP